jgi:uncharacterized protein (TIGR03083 family)
MIDLSTITDQDRVVLLEQAFSSLEEVCALLDDEQWDRPTDLPGWSVKDNLSHVAHFESTAMGMEQPPSRDIDGIAHVADDFQRLNELGVHARRVLPGAQILDEFRTASTQRLKTLTGLDEAGWAATDRSPLGELPTRSFVAIRVLDVFFHEQDIRRAVGRPGHLDGEVARFMFARFATVSLPRVVAKQAAAPDGSVVVFDIAAPGETIAIRSEAGKGTLVPAPADPTVRLTMDFEAFLLLLGGRKTPEQLGARLRIDGDAALAASVLDKIRVLP